jgi:hypothetical protein
MYSTIRLFVFFVLFSCSPVRIYQQLPEVRSWEEEIRKFEHLDSLENYPRDAILFVGSSSIRLWSTLTRDMYPYPVIQRGYGGAKLSDLSVYAERIIYPHPCRAIVLFVANDISGSDDDKEPGEVVGLFRSVLKTIRKKFPDTPVFWIAITPTVLRWQVWPQIAKVNEGIRKVCEKNDHVYFIKTDYAFLDNNAQPDTTLFQPDRLHLNEEGYTVWTKIIRKSLSEVLDSNN